MTWSQKFTRWRPYLALATLVGISLWSRHAAADLPDFGAGFEDLDKNLRRWTATGIGTAGAIVGGICTAYAGWKLMRKDHEGLWYLIGTAVGAAVFFIAKKFVS
jgi:hypothetical protein